KLFYDAAYGQATQQHILGVFAVGPISKPYLERQGEGRKTYLLEELDRSFDGKASPNYKKHIFQNWSEEPFTQGAYVHYFENWKHIRTLGKPVGNKLYFAGDAYTDGSEWSSVHAAAQSAKKVVEQLMG
ncbi:MAG: FAD-dependent oxidoreductase, partial [Bacteroidota bacterium]